MIVLCAICLLLVAVFCALRPNWLEQKVFARHALASSRKRSWPGRIFAWGNRSGAGGSLSVAWEAVLDSMVLLRRPTRQYLGSRRSLIVWQRGKELSAANPLR